MAGAPLPDCILLMCGAMRARRLIFMLGLVLLQGEVTGEEILRVATLNLWHSSAHLAERTDATCQALQDLDADLIGLQEVSGSLWRRNRAALLGRALDSHVYYRPSDGVRAVFAEGLAVLSRAPFQRRGRTRLVHSKLWPFERRFVQWAEVRFASGQRFILLNTHLTHRSGALSQVERLEQALEVIRVAAEQALKRDIPAVLVGDFNANPSELALAAFSGDLLGLPAPFGDAWTASGTGDGATYSPDCLHNSPDTPRQRIDYVLVLRGTSVQPRPLKAWRIGHEGTPLSDHYGVAVDLELVPLPSTSRPSPSRSASLLLRRLEGVEREVALVRSEIQRSRAPWNPMRLAKRLRESLPLPDPLPAPSLELADASTP